MRKLSQSGSRVKTYDFRQNNNDNPRQEPRQIIVMTFTCQNNTYTNRRKDRRRNCPYLTYLKTITLKHQHNLS